MKGIKQIIGSKIVIAALLLAVVIIGGLNIQKVTAQMIQDCSNNSVIKCGASSPEDLVAKIRANNPADLQAVYSHFNLTPDRYDEFASEAKMGMANRTGDVVVNGTVVARNAWSIGRDSKSYSEQYRIGNTTYHRSDSTEVLRQDLPVMVWFNDQGKVEIAVLAACGNPMGGDLVAPPPKAAAAPAKPVCRQLRAEAVSQSGPMSEDDSSEDTNSSDNIIETVSSTADETSSETSDSIADDSTVNNAQDDTYRFSTDAPAIGGATISRVVYDFGDGTTEERTDPADEVTHRYAEAGNYTAKATVYATGSDGQEVAVNSGGCTKQISIEPQAPVETPVTPVATPPTPTPTPAPELPKAGMAGAVGLFGGASILGAIGYRIRMSRRLSRVDQLVERISRR